MIELLVSNERRQQLMQNVFGHLHTISTMLQPAGHLGYVATHLPSETRFQMTVRSVTEYRTV